MASKIGKQITANAIVEAIVASMIYSYELTAHPVKLQRNTKMTDVFHTLNNFYSLRIFTMIG